ncbi:MAG: 30S ribosomal protein S9 [Candidatus Kapabacteria bacterium]|nr:30S ribosomal protein S9 [Candidatus Kapabacteria bacterium]
MSVKQFYGTGRRKTSVARVFITPGTGNIIVNKKEFSEYFPVATTRQHALRPLASAQVEGKFDVKILVHGGGKSGQAGAVSLGIARALVQFDEQLRPIMRKDELLTRDPRMVERKKYGQKKARKRFQFSKR